MGQDRFLDAVIQSAFRRQSSESNSLPVLLSSVVQMRESHHLSMPCWVKNETLLQLTGTTRDSIDTVYNQYGFEFVLVDTAGIRKNLRSKRISNFIQ